ncbi:hypothetical protein [Microvirga tunisiensis]|uniref:MarR family transcriptional regulator n=1 Tax=Microvirga tunisiensis TaxID=2108360 RepID=A0A5N7MP24_9HYPH|nr:hypothetical protein [Microvirga tunisiensis]MPR07489.1 hypothetical protein [Microvirga tunisiensis]MPR25756.1 hypothetical protein [Microvirga tunisiensis]
MQQPKPGIPEKSLLFVRKAIIRMVLSDLRRTETGNQALQHLGLLWIIYDYASVDEPISSAELQELTGVVPSVILRLTTRLEKLGLIARQRMKGSRGRAWAYSPALPNDVLQSGIVGLPRHISTSLATPETLESLERELMPDKDGE